MLEPSALRLTPSSEFAWLPLALDQKHILDDLYGRYCRRYSIKPGVPQAQHWLAIVQLRDGVPRKIGGVVGANFVEDQKALEITGLYVYPHRLGLAAMEATLRGISELYDAGYVRVVCCHVITANWRMKRLIRAFFNERGARPVAELWAVGV